MWRVRMRLQESGEMYLKTILLLSEKQDVVRGLDIANRMGFSKPSVSRAVGILKNEGYINVDDDNHITLTNEGYDIAIKIRDRHLAITNMLTSLGVGYDLADSDACRIEHVISDETYEAIKKAFKNK